MGKYFVGFSRLPLLLGVRAICRGIFIIIVSGGKSSLYLGNICCLGTSLWIHRWALFLFFCRLVCLASVDNFLNILLVFHSSPTLSLAFLQSGIAKENV